MSGRGRMAASLMRQYTYEITNRRTGRIERARATAASDAIARAQILMVYGTQFAVADLYADIDPAHRILGEINCADFPMSDVAWLMSAAAAIEGGAA